MEIYALQMCPVNYKQLTPLTMRYLLEEVSLVVDNSMKMPVMLRVNQANDNESVPYKWMVSAKCCLSVDLVQIFAIGEYSQWIAFIELLQPPQCITKLNSNRLCIWMLCVAQNSNQLHASEKHMLNEQQSTEIRSDPAK